MSGAGVQGMQAIRVLLVDDHAIARNGVRLMLGTAEGINVTGEACNAAEALLRLAEAEYDVALVDIHLVDTASNTVRGIRAVTLPHGITRDFLAAVQDQFADARSTAPILARYMAIDLLKLRNLAAMHRCG